MPKGNKQKEVKKMTNAEKKAIKVRIEDLIEMGIEKELAKTMAKVEFEYEMIKPVVNF